MLRFDWKVGVGAYGRACGHRQVRESIGILWRCGGGCAAAEGSGESGWQPCCPDASAERSASHAQRAWPKSRGVPHKAPSQGIGRELEAFAYGRECQARTRHEVRVPDAELEASDIGMQCKGESERSEGSGKHFPALLRFSKFEWTLMQQ